MRTFAKWMVWLALAFSGLTYAVGLPGYATLLAIAAALVALTLPALTPAPSASRPEPGLPGEGRAPETRDRQKGNASEPLHPAVVPEALSSEDEAPVPAEEALAELILDGGWEHLTIDDFSARVRALAATIEGRSWTCSSGDSLLENALLLGAPLPVRDLLWELGWRQMRSNIFQSLVENDVSLEVWEWALNRAQAFSWAKEGQNVELLEVMLDQDLPVEFFEALSSAMPQAWWCPDPAEALRQMVARDSLVAALPLLGQVSREVLEEIALEVITDFDLSAPDVRDLFLKMVDLGVDFSALRSSDGPMIAVMASEGAEETAEAVIHALPQGRAQWRALGQLEAASDNDWSSLTADLLSASRSSLPTTG